MKSSATNKMASKPIIVDFTDLGDVYKGYRKILRRLSTLRKKEREINQEITHLTMMEGRLHRLLKNKGVEV